MPMMLNIGKSFEAFRIEDMSSNYIDGYNNVWSLGKNENDEEGIKSLARYLSLEVIVSPTEFLLLPIKYIPPVSPTLKDFDLTISEDGKYELEFEKDGLCR